MQAENDRLNLLLQLRHHREAETFARECLGRNPDWAYGYCHLARALLAQKRMAEALAAARTAVGKAPQDAWAHGILALIHVDGGDPKSALKCVDDALRVYPSYGWAFYLKAHAYEHLGNYKAMQNAATEGLACEPQDPFLLCKLGWSQNYLGQYRAALRTALDGLQLEPNSAAFWNLRGATHQDMGSRGLNSFTVNHYQLADRAYTEAIRLNPIEATYRSNRDLNLRHCHANGVLVMLAAFLALIFANLYGESSGIHKVDTLAETIREGSFKPLILTMILLLVVDLNRLCLRIWNWPWLAPGGERLTRRERLIGKTGASIAIAICAVNFVTLIWTIFL